MSDVPLESDPALLHKWKLDLDKNLCGEDKNKLITVLILATSKNSHPMHLAILGESAAGKSHLLHNTLSYYDNVIVVQRITTASLNRFQDDLTGKILVVEEMAGVEEAQEQIRVMISEGNLSLLTSVYDDKGNIAEKSKIVQTKGTPVFITTTPEPTLENETTTRLFVTSIDESPEQTRRILAMQGLKAANVGTLETPIDPAFKMLISGLQPADRIVIPYAPQLSEVFPSDTIKSRRDFKKLLNIIEIITFIHQQQRPRVNFNHESYLISLPIDFYLAWRIADEAIIETLTGLNMRFKRIMGLFTGEQHYTVQDVARNSGLSASRCHELLKELSNQSFLQRDDSVRPFVYYRNPEKKLITFSIDALDEYLASFTEDKLKTFYSGLLTTSCGANLEMAKYISLLETIIISIDSTAKTGTFNPLELRQMLFMQGYSIDWWCYSNTYVDPLTGNSFQLGSPEFSSFFSAVRSQIAEKKRESSPESQTEQEVTSSKSIGSKLNAEQLLTSILEEQSCAPKMINYVVGRMREAGIESPEATRRAKSRKNEVYFPKDGYISLSTGTLQGLVEPGHIT